MTSTWKGGLEKFVTCLRIPKFLNNRSIQLDLLFIFRDKGDGVHGHFV